MLISFVRAPTELPAKTAQPLVFTLTSVFSVACIAVFKFMEILTDTTAVR